MGSLSPDKFRIILIMIIY